MTQEVDSALHEAAVSQTRTQTVCGARESIKRKHNMVNGAGDSPTPSETHAKGTADESEDDVFADSRLSGKRGGQTLDLERGGAHKKQTTAGAVGKRAAQQRDSDDSENDACEGLVDSLHQAPATKASKQTKRKGQGSGSRPTPSQGHVKDTTDASEDDVFAVSRPRRKCGASVVDRAATQQKSWTVREVGGRAAEDRGSGLDELEELRRFKTWAQANAQGVCQQFEVETGPGCASVQQASL